jgi:hypothetical protein
VSERLNSLLESPPTLLLAERGDTAPLQPGPGFRLLATFTPPTRRGGPDVGVEGRELSPALSNRFSQVVVDDPMQAPEAEFRSEIEQIAAAVCGDAAGSQPGAAALAAAACAFLRAELGTVSGCGRGRAPPVAPLTLRTFVLFLDSAYAAHSGALVTAGQAGGVSDCDSDSIGSVDSFAAALFTAYTIVFGPRLAALPELMQRHVAVRLREVLRLPPPNANADADAESSARCGAAALLSQLAQRMGGRHVLAGSRVAAGAAVVSAVCCCRPVLLEGPAAVGKTSLVAALAAAWPDGPRALVRVNNADTTGVADYFGSYLPSGAGFSFAEGPLVRAVRLGHWFVAGGLAAQVVQQGMALWVDSMGPRGWLPCHWGWHAGTMLAPDIVVFFCYKLAGCAVLLASPLFYQPATPVSSRHSHAPPQLIQQQIQKSTILQPNQPKNQSCNQPANQQVS